MVENNILANNPLFIVDVGASGGIDSRWKNFSSNFRAILFEPDPREYEILKSFLVRILSESLIFLTFMYKNLDVPSNINTKISHN